MRVIVVTANLGNFDEVKPLPKQTVDHDYICFTEKNLPFPLVNLPNDRMKCRYLKTQMHKYIDYEYDIYIWIDGRVEITSEKFVEEYISPITNSAYSFVGTLHPDRNTVFEELDYIENHLKIDSQYIKERYSDQPLYQERDLYNIDLSFHNGKNTPLLASGVFARISNNYINRMCDEWWDKCVQYTTSDQTWLSYLLFMYNVEVKYFPFSNDLFVLNKHKIKPKEMITKDDFVNTVLLSIDSKIPMAFVRYGDGEAIVLEERHEKNVGMKEFVMKRQLGYIPTEDVQDLIADNLAIAYRECNVIGLPEQRHNNRNDSWGSALRVFKKELGEEILMNKIIASIDVCYHLLSDASLAQMNELYQDPYEKILGDRDVVNIISCRDIADKLQKKYRIKKINQFIIAPEMKFTSGYNGEKHFPDQFNKIESWMDSIEVEGNVCLVGAGVIGKIYNIWFKQRGGISLDLGAVFDLWAGRNTRGKERGLDVIDDTYKI